MNSDGNLYIKQGKRYKRIPWNPHNHDRPLGFPQDGLWLVRRDKHSIGARFIATQQELEGLGPSIFSYAAVSLKQDDLAKEIGNFFESRTEYSHAELADAVFRYLVGEQCKEN